MSLPTLLLLAAGISALLAIAAEERTAGRHPAFYALKPLTTTLILAAVWATPAREPIYAQWIVAGLALSLCGDIALMFAGDRAFIAGLGSFLIAHGVFVAAFHSSHGWLAPPLWSLLACVPALAFFGWLIPRTGPMKGPVVVYGLSLLAMALVAAARAQVVDDRAAWLASIGAFVFIVSDASLAVRQFQRPYRRAQALILSTYWTAIGLLALSVG